MLPNNLPVPVCRTRASVELGNTCPTVFVSDFPGTTTFRSSAYSVISYLLLVAGRTISWQPPATSQTAAQPAAASAYCQLTIAQYTSHCTLGRGLRAPAHTRFLAIALQNFFIYQAQDVRIYLTQLNSTQG